MKKVMMHIEGPPAQKAWLTLWEYFRAERGFFTALAAEFDMSPVQLHILSSLQPGEHMAMNALANILSCDNSNVTGLVDRLESRGWIERRNAEHDRRIKMIGMTEAGVQIREQLLKRMAQPPRSITGLSLEDQNAIIDILTRALANRE